MKYDYYLAGRWRNFKNIEPVLEKIRQKGKKVYCFIENEYDSDGIINRRSQKHVEADMQKNEKVKDWQNNKTYRKIFDNDSKAIRESDAFLAVFPFGFSGHAELGYAYGLGKKCYAIGRPEKTETYYFMFDKIFPSAESFLEKI